MEVKAVYKYARISAKKMRDVAQEIQGLSVSQATDILSYTPKKGAYLLNKTLKSALANAENNAELSVDTLVVKSVMVLNKVLEAGFTDEKAIAAMTMDDILSMQGITVADITLINDLQKSIKSNKVISFLGGGAE